MSDRIDSLVGHKALRASWSVQGMCFQHSEMLVDRSVLDNALRDHRFDGAFDVRKDDIPSVRVETGIGAERSDIDHVVFHCRVGPADE